MKKEVLEFYESQGLNPIEIIKKGKLRGLHASQIEQAMEVVYYKPDKAKPARLALDVWTEAKHLKGETYVIAKGIIVGQRKQIKRLKIDRIVLFCVTWIELLLFFAYVKWGVPW